MSLSIKEAKEIGDKTLGRVGGGGSVLVTKIRDILQSQNMALSMSEIKVELENGLSNEEKFQLFATETKSCFDKKGNVVVDRLLSIRLSHMVLDSSKKAQRVRRTVKKGVTYYYWFVEEELPTGNKKK